MKKLIPALIFAFSSFAPLAHGQEITTRGKEFWVGFMANWTPGYSAAYTIQISSDKTTQGIVMMPLGGFVAPFLVKPDSITVIPIPTAAAEHNGSEVPQNRGIVVLADDTISVFATNIGPYSTDASLVLPVSALAFDYYVASSPGVTNTQSEFLVVATQDFTEVFIVPSQKTMAGVNAGDTIKVMLMRGMSYQVQAPLATMGNDLTGTRVWVNDRCKPIAVFGGNTCGTPGNAGNCDHLFEQMYPTRAWGESFHTPHLAEQGNVIYRVLCAEDNTSILVNNNPPVVRNAGKFYEFQTNQPVRLRATKPVALAQYCSGGAYGPFMQMISSDPQTVMNATFNIITGPAIPKHYVNIVTRAPYVSSMRLDGKDISSEFVAFPGDPTWSYARVNLNSTGSISDVFTLKANGGFQAYVYGYGSADSYGYCVGSAFRDLGLDFTIEGSGCTGGTMTFKPTFPKRFVPDTFIWDLGDGTFTSDTVVNHVYKAPGKYKVRLRLVDSNSNCPGMFSADSVVKIITIGEGPVFELKADTNRICLGDSTRLHVTKGAMYSWDPDQYVSHKTGSDPWVKPNKTTKFYVWVRDSLGVCAPGVDSITIEVLGKPIAGCDWYRNGLDVQFYGSSWTGVNEWYWDFGDRSTPSTDRNPSHNYVQEDSFLVTLIVKNPCGYDTTKFWVSTKSNAVDSGKVGIQDKVVQAGMMVYPNPSRNLLQLVLSPDHPSVQAVHFTDITGRSLPARFVLASTEGLEGSATMEFDLSTLGTYRGVFFLHVESAEGTQVFRLVRE